MLKFSYIINCIKCFVDVSVHFTDWLKQFGYLSAYYNIYFSLFMATAMGTTHLNIDVNEFYSKKITNKVSQQIQVSLLVTCQTHNILIGMSDKYLIQ